MINIYSTQVHVVSAAIWTGNNYSEAWELLTGKLNEPMQTDGDDWRITHDERGNVQLYMRNLPTLTRQNEETEDIIPYGFYIVRFQNGVVQFMSPEAFSTLFVPTKDL